MEITIDIYLTNLDGNMRLLHDKVDEADIVELNYKRIANEDIRLPIGYNAKNTDIKIVIDKVTL
jgi:hypothetical protein